MSDSKSPSCEKTDGSNGIVLTGLGTLLVTNADTFEGSGRTCTVVTAVATDGPGRRVWTTPMRKYLYIVAEMDPNDEDSPISFAHGFVLADNADHACELGSKAWDRQDLIGQNPERVIASRIAVEI